MSYEFEMPDEFEGGGSFHDAPGTFHLIVSKVDEGRLPWDQEEHPHGFTLHYEILAGTDATQVHRTGKFGLEWSESDKDGGRFRRSVQGLCFVATNMVTLGQRGQKVKFDLASVVGEQLVARFKLRKGKEERSFPELDGGAIFHVDDPRVDTIPKDKDALGLIPKAKRQPHDYFKPLIEKEKSEKSANGNGAQAGKKPDFSNL